MREAFFRSVVLQITMILFVALEILVITPSATVAEQRVGAVLSEEQDIPTGYNSWSVFLVCNPGWLLDNNHSKLIDLYREFVAFGTVIGPKNAAIWFSKANGKAADSANNAESFAEHYDASRAAQFCEKYHVLPSRSPYIIVTTERPNLKDSLGDYYKMSLGGADAETTLHLLQSLADQIVSENLDQEDLDSETYWRKWEQIGRDFLSNSGNVLNRLSISIDTHFFKIELTPSH